VNREEHSPGGNLVRRVKCANDSRPGSVNGPAMIATCSNTHPRSTIGAGQHVVSRLRRSLNRDGFSTNLPPWCSGRRQSHRLRLATALDVLSAAQECGLLTLSQILCRGTMSGILSVRDASTPKPRRSNSGSNSRAGDGWFQKQKAMDGVAHATQITSRGMCGFPFGFRWRLYVDISARRWATAGAGTELSGHYRQGFD